MSAYQTAVNQVRERGFVDDETISRLSAADLQRAIEEASRPA